MNSISSSSASPERANEDRLHDVLKETQPLLAKPERVSALDLVGFLRSVKSHFGGKLLSVIILSHGGLKGFAEAFVVGALPYLLRDFRVPAAQAQLYSSVCALAWAMKPVIGIVSDMYPVAGYNRGPYIALTSAVGALALLCVGAVPESMLSAPGVVGLVFLFNIQVVTADLLTQATYSERIQDRPAQGSSLVSLVWSLVATGALLSAVFLGWVIGRFGARACFLVAAGPSCGLILPVLLGFMQERRQTVDEQIKRRQGFFEQKELAVLCLVMFCGPLLLGVSGVRIADPFLNAAVALLVASVATVCFSVLLSPPLAKFCSFILVQSALCPQVTGATFYFYTDSVEQYPEGPHFSTFFFVTVRGFSACFLGLLGIFVWHQFLSTWRYRNVVVVSQCLCCGFSLVDIMMFARLNIRLGIPDRLLMLGMTCEPMLLSINRMPLMLLMSFLCPRGMEATVFALVVGASNLGRAISLNFGALLLAHLGVQPSGAPGESKQFESLWMASAVSAVMPLAVLAFLWHLIPDARQNEQVERGDDYTATSGSIWKRWASSKADGLARTEMAHALPA